MYGKHRPIMRQMAAERKRKIENLKGNAFNEGLTLRYERSSKNWILTGKASYEKFKDFYFESRNLLEIELVLQNVRLRYGDYLHPTRRTV